MWIFDLEHGHALAALRDQDGSKGCNEPDGGPRECMRLGRRSNEELGVEQELYSMTPNNLGISSSDQRSSGTTHFSWGGIPTLWASRLGCSMGITFATGLPAFAIMNGSPSPIFSMRRDIC